MKDFCLVLHATGIILTEVIIVVALGLFVCKLYKAISPTLKKNEPAIRQRVHELARAINW